MKDIARNIFMIYSIAMDEKMGYYNNKRKKVEAVQIEYSKKAVKYINSADKLTKKRLKEAIEKIPLGDIKRLKGINEAYRLRVGDLRILFSMKNDIIYIENIIPRGQAYKRL